MTEVEELIKIREQLELNVAAFARHLGVSPKTIHNYEKGVYAVNTAVLRRARKLRARWGKRKPEPVSTAQADLPLEPEPEPEPPPKKPGFPTYAMPDNLKQIRLALGLSQRAMGKLFGIHGSYYQTWESGLIRVAGKYHAYLQTLTDYALANDGKRDSPPYYDRDPNDRPRGRRPTNQSTLLTNNEALLAATTKFHEQYRAERNQRDVQAFVEFAEKEFGLTRAVAVQYLLTALYTLSKDMTIEALTECLGKVR